MYNLLILYYSRHGTTRKLAQQIARGVEKIDGCQAILRTVDEILLSKQAHSCHTNDKKNTPPPIALDPVVTLDELASCDGLAMGSPVWFGNMAAPLKHFWDQTSPMWLKGSLIDKPACVFSSSSSLHGGQETTLQSMMLPLMHHGMLLLGLPYSEPALHLTAHGGTPYGPTALASQHKTNLSKEEIELAQNMGKRLARIASQLKAS